MTSATSFSGRLVAVLVMVASSLAAPAHAADSDAGERARLAEQRSAIEARFVARDAECRQRFVVSACAADARHDRRTALDALRARQRVLDDARRQERASERRAALAAKATEDTRREGERAARAASSPAAGGSSASSPREGRRFEGRREKSGRQPTVASPSRDRSAARSSASSAPALKAAPATRRQLEERSRASFAARQQEAARHREDSVAATIKRMEKHSPARSLPVPPAPSAASAQ